MRLWTLSLAGVVSVLAFAVQPAAAEHPTVPVTPAVLTIGSDAQFEGSGHSIVEVRYPRSRGRARVYTPPHWRPPHYGTYRVPGRATWYPHPYGYRYPHPYPVHPYGGVYFHGPRVGIGLGW